MCYRLSGACFAAISAALGAVIDGLGFTSGDHVPVPAAARSMTVIRRGGTYVSLFPKFEVLPILKG